MRKSLFIIFLLSISFILNAQAIKSLSFTGSYASSNRIFHDAVGTQFFYMPYNSWSVDAGALFWKKKSFSFSLHAGYLKKGYKVGHGTFIPGQAENLYILTTLLHYAYVAPRFTVSGKHRKLFPLLFISPRIDGYLGASASSTIDGRFFYRDRPGDGGIIDYYNKNARDFIPGITVGIGADKPIGKHWSVGIELAWYGEFAPILIENDETKEFYNAHHRVFTAGVSFKYKTKGQ